MILLNYFVPLQTVLIPVRWLSKKMAILKQKVCILLAFKFTFYNHLRDFKYNECREKI